MVLLAPMPPPGAYVQLCAACVHCFQVLDSALKAVRTPSPQLIASLDSQLAEVEDMLAYCADVLTTGATCSPGLRSCQNDYDDA